MPDASDLEHVDESPPFDGDPAWRVQRRLADGTAITIRGIGPDDREELRRGLLELSPESRYLRFLAYSGSEPSDEVLTYLTHVDQKDHVALGATITSPDLKSERGVGIARFVRLNDQEDTAEAAVTVADDMHRRGIGKALLHELLRAAEIRGIKRIRAEVLRDNGPMRAILDRAGAIEVDRDSDSRTIAYDLVLGTHDRPSLFALLKMAAETMALRFRRP